MKYFPYSPFLARCGSQTTRPALTWNLIRNSDAGPTHLRQTEAESTVLQFSCHSWRYYYLNVDLNVII